MEAFRNDLDVVAEGAFHLALVFLQLALVLLHLAFAFEAGVVGGVTEDFLGLANGLVGVAFDLFLELSQ